MKNSDYIKLFGFAALILLLCGFGSVVTSKAIKTQGELLVACSKFANNVDMESRFRMEDGKMVCLILDKKVKSLEALGYKSYTFYTKEQLESTYDGFLMGVNYKAKAAFYECLSEKGLKTKKDVFSRIKYVGDSTKIFQECAKKTNFDLEYFDLEFEWGL